MNIKEIYAVNFRNYASCSLKLSSPITVFYGNNAQGKTNMLEAVFYAAFGLSHRTSGEEALMKLGADAMAVGVKYEDAHGMHTVKIKKYLQSGRANKEILLDGAKVRPKEHFGALSVVLFSPEDLQLVKGEPALRRRFYDLQISQTDRLYFELLTKYNKVLQQRNRLLKAILEDKADQATLGTWDGEFARLASKITLSRLESLKKLRIFAGKIYSSIAGGREDLALAYELKANNGEVLKIDGSFNADPDFYLAKLSERRFVDIHQGSTGIGPHRDDLLILLDGLPMRQFASQGQQRSAALALKLSQLEYVKGEAGEYPVLLLDDVMSELDSSRRTQLLRFIDGKIQTFITVNDKGLLPELEGTGYYKIEAGTLTEG